MKASPRRGDFVRVRSRRWLVEGERERGPGLTSLALACVDDDAQGESAEVVWDAELDGELLADEGWSAVAQSGTDDPAVFAAYLKTLTWNTATAACQSALKGDPLSASKRDPCDGLDRRCPLARSRRRRGDGQRRHRCLTHVDGVGVRACR